MILPLISCREMLRRLQVQGMLCLLCVAALGLAGLGESAAQGRDAGEFNGAVWRFTMKPRTKEGMPLRGQFRVQNDVLYQRVNASDTQFTKVVGSNHPLPKEGKTRIDVTDFSAVAKKGKVVSGLKGSFLLRFVKFGHWTGEFVDSGGRHYEATCTRLRE